MSASHQRFRLAFVGGAPNSAAGYAHFVAARMDGLWDLQAGAFSRDPATNIDASEVYGVATSRTYSSLPNLLEAEVGNVDAIAVLTPTPNHHATVVQCLQHGVPVICEKALAMTSAQAVDISDLARLEKGFLAVIYNYSGYPMVRELRRVVQKGILGEVLHFQAEMPQEGFIRTDEKGNKPIPQEWRLSDGPIPTLHLDLAVHLHELIYYLTSQRPLEVISDQSSNGWFPVVDDAGCLVRYTQGMRGQLWFSKTALGLRNGLRLRLYGSKASAEWVQANPEELNLSYADGRRQIIDRASNTEVASLARYNRFKAGHPAGFNEALANLYFDIHGALAEYKNTGVQMSDEVFGADLAIEGLRLLEAMVRSTESKRWEAVNTYKVPT